MFIDKREQISSTLPLRNFYWIFPMGFLCYSTQYYSRKSKMADSVCENLDELTLDFFDKFEQLQAKREEICRKMRDGYLNLSQARYSMGNKSVCSLQYSENMKATSLVEMNENGEVAFDIVKDKPGDSKEEKNEDNPSSLRKRKGKQKPERDDKDISAEDSKKDDDLVVEDLPLEDLSLKVRKQTDPLKWFGVLVPMCLRTGQAQFKSTIDLCCEIVNLENDIKILMSKYRTLKQLKVKQKDEK